MTPGTGEYVIGTPLFDKATLTFADGKTTVIEADPTNRYIDSITLNGREYAPTYFRHDDLTAGSRIKFVTSATPNTVRGTLPEEAPYSFTVDKVKESKK